VKLSLLCRSATTFSKTGELDEDAFRLHLQRFVDQNIGVCLGTGGAGESHTLSRGELRRVYEIGVETCGGRVPVHANPPEQHTARGMLDQALLAVEAGVEVVNIYQPAGWHGFRPTDAEQVAYFDEVLSTLKHPVAIAPLPLIGSIPSAGILADICRRYRQVIAVHLVGVDDNYLIDMREMLADSVALYVTTRGSLTAFPLGANGIIGAEMNVLPKTYRLYIDLYERKMLEEAARVYAELMRVIRYVSRWNETNARWVKMSMRAFNLPGAEGGLRAPARMPGNDELQAFTEGLLRLGVPEISELARSAGLTLRA
jgi:dihydrodipicolinate synthase/N-acetylneuraminate lyase